jgi:cell division protein FtsB
MRFSNEISTTAPVRLRANGLSRLVVIAMALVFGAWMVWAYAQEAVLVHRLNQQVTDLRHQNAVIAAQNQGYHTDIQAMTNGAADEEEARLNGYTKPQERVYLVTSPAPPPASPSPSH